MYCFTSALSNYVKLLLKLSSSTLLFSGVGRTGTFIVIDSSIQRLKNNEELLDIYGHVTLLRNQRNFMVQTEVSRVASP